MSLVSQYASCSMHISFLYRTKKSPSIILTKTSTYIPYLGMYCTPGHARAQV